VHSEVAGHDGDCTADHALKKRAAGQQLRIKVDLALVIGLVEEYLQGGAILKHRSAARAQLLPPLAEGSQRLVGAPTHQVRARVLLVVEFVDHADGQDQPHLAEPENLGPRDLIQPVIVHQGIGIEDHRMARPLSQAAEGSHFGHQRFKGSFLPFDLRVDQGRRAGGMPVHLADHLEVLAVQPRADAIIVLEQ
jgi:hypothetical protein